MTMLKKVSVTYHAPKGDSKVVEAWGAVFYDGKAETVTVTPAIYEEMSGNRFFELGKPTDVSQADTERERVAEREKAQPTQHSAEHSRK